MDKARPNTSADAYRGASPRLEKVYRLLPLISPLVVLLTWEATVQAGVLDARFFPAPSTVVSVLVEMIATGELFDHLGISLQRITLGFLVGALPGMLLGLLMGWFRWFRAFLKPLIAATYPIPKISILPLILLVFGLGETSKVIIVAIAVFFLVLIVTADGVARIDPILLQAAQNYGARGWNLFAKVILPAALPSIATSLRLALGTALLIIVAAEFTAANRGIGYLIWMSWSTLAVGKMYAGLTVIALLGILFASGLDRVIRSLMPWAQNDQERYK